MSRALTILRDIFGYSEFRGQQAKIIAHVASSHVCLVLMPTGAQLLNFIHTGHAGDIGIAY